MGIFLNIWLLIPQNIRLLSYRILVRLGLRLYGPTTSWACFRLPFNLYAKVGYDVDMHEANALCYISQHVGGPVPYLIDAIPVPTGAFIVMTGLPGKPLEDRLLRMSPQQRSLLAYDLKQFFDQLQSIPPPQEGPRICGIDGGPFICYRVVDERIGHSLQRRISINFSMIDSGYQSKIVSKPLQNPFTHDLTPFVSITTTWHHKIYS